MPTDPATTPDRAAPEAAQYADDMRYELTREQVMALTQTGGDTTKQATLLREILGRCGSTWNGLRCRSYDGHKNNHHSEWDGAAWAAWETHAAHSDGASDG